MRSPNNRVDLEIGDRGVLPGDSDPNTFLIDGALGNFEPTMPPKKDEPGKTFYAGFFI